MRKILPIIAAIIGVLATIGVTQSSITSTASAAEWRPAGGGKNCVTPAEKNRLRAGISPGDVRRITGANPWLKVGDTYNGQRVSLEAFDSCRGPGQALAVMYRIDGNGGRHLMLARFIAI